MQFLTQHQGWWQLIISSGGGQQWRAALAGGLLEGLKGNIWVQQRWLAMAGGGGGRKQRQRRQGLTFCSFIETEFLVLGVVGKGQRRNAGSKNFQLVKLTYVGNWY
jgi:hypothetical protein